MGLLLGLHRKAKQLAEVVHRDGNDQVGDEVEAEDLVATAAGPPSLLGDLLLRRLADAHEELLGPMLGEHDGVEEVERALALARAVEGREVREDGGLRVLVLESTDVRAVDVGERLLVLEDLLDGLARVDDGGGLDGSRTARVVALGDLEVLEDLAGRVRSGEGEEGVLREGRGSASTGGEGRKEKRTVELKV